MSFTQFIGSFRILTINDVYAFTPIDGLGGYGGISSLINKYKTDHCLILINGDFLGGSSLAEHFKGKCVIDVLNEIGINYCVIGNHEFDFGNEELQKRISESKFKWLGSNIKYKQSKKLFNQVYDTCIETFTYKDNNNKDIHIKIGLFGVCTLDTPVLSWPGKDIIFEPIIPCCTQKVNELQEKSDFIIAVTHVELLEDLNIADKLSNINLILGGHDHFPYNHITKSGSLVFKAGQNAYWLGVIDYDIELIYKQDTNSTSFKFYPSWKMISNRNIKENENIVKIINKYSKEKENDDSLIDKNEFICTVIKGPLITKTSLVRCDSAQIMNIIADGICSFYKYNNLQGDFAIINGGIVRGDREYPIGTKITRGIMMEELPFPLRVVLIKIKGKYIKQALEEHLYKYPAPLGSYPHVSKQLYIKYDGNRDPMDRILEIKYNGNNLDNEKEYLLTTTKFLSIGGDGIKSYTKGIVIGEPVLLFDLCLSYMKCLIELDTTLIERVIRIKD